MPEFTSDSKQLYTQTPVGFKRTNRVPLDVDAVMGNFKELKEYMKSGAFYIGQRIAITLYSLGGGNAYIIMCVNSLNKLDVVSVAGGITGNIELHFETINHENTNYRCLMIAYRNGALPSTGYDYECNINDPNLFNIIVIAKYIYAFSDPANIKVFRKNITNDSIIPESVNLNNDIFFESDLRAIIERNSQMELYVSVGNLFDKVWS